VYSANLWGTNLARTRLSDSAEANDNNRWWRSISVRLLIPVNGVCFALLLLFIALDYRQETKQRMSDVRTGLLEEAASMQVATSQIRRVGDAALQEYIDQVCGRMDDTHSAGHHIILRIGDRVLQAQSDHRQSDVEIRSIESAVSRGEYLVRSDRHELIVGSARSGDVLLIICEVVDEVRREIAKESLLRLSGSLLLGLIAAVIVNMVLLRIVVRPLGRLVAFAAETGTGRFGLRADVFPSCELNALSHALSDMSRSLEELDCQRRTQLQKARRIQQHLLPATPQLKGVTFAARYEPADDVAGDFYDVKSLADGSWVAMMADVTGHGIPAAMTATLLKAHFAEGCEHSSDLLQIVQSINRRFTALTLDGDFASAVLLRFMPDSGTLQIVNAGHDAVLHLQKNGQLFESTSTGMLLGVADEVHWSIDEIRTATGDRLLLFTDGVTETFDVNREMFGRGRVEDILKTTSDHPPSQVLDSLLLAVSEYRGDAHQLDDVTVILLEF
jgi:sigma-B regulation protein RsbU (phosphoserine phosphatase)